MRRRSDVSSRTGSIPSAVITASVTRPRPPVGRYAAPPSRPEVGRSRTSRTGGREAPPRSLPAKCPRPRGRVPSVVWTRVHHRCSRPGRARKRPLMPRCARIYRRATSPPGQVACCDCPQRNVRPSPGTARVLAKPSPVDQVAALSQGWSPAGRPPRQQGSPSRHWAARCRRGRRAR